MSRRSDWGFLRDLRDHAREAVAMFDEATPDDLEGNRMLHLALERLVQNVGEGAARLSPEFLSAHPEIPWRRIVGMRNRLAHDYRHVVRERVHDTVAIDLPKLIEQLNAILGEE